MNLSTDTQLQGYSHQKPGPLRACGGYFHTNMDHTPFGDYSAPWSTTDGRGNGKSDMHDYDKLNQSSSSMAMDDMVSRLIDDEGTAISSGFVNMAGRTSGLFGARDPWQQREEKSSDSFSNRYQENYNTNLNMLANPGQQTQGQYEGHVIARLEGRKLVGRQQHLSSSSTRSSDSAFDISLDPQLTDSPWSNTAPKSEPTHNWPNTSENKGADIWNERPTCSDLFVDTGQPWLREYDKPVRGDQLLRPGVEQSPARHKVDHVSDIPFGPSALQQSPDAAFPYRTAATTATSTAAGQHHGNYHQVQRPTGISVSGAPMMRTTQQRFSPVSPGQPPIGAYANQPMIGRTGQVSQLQRQAALHQQQLRYGQNSPLANNSYTHLSRSPISDTSSLGSPVARAPDSPMFGPQSNSPLLNSPQTGAMPIAHAMQQQHLAEYIASSTAGHGSEPLMPMVPTIVYGPGGQLMYEMVALSPQQANKLQGGQHQYQHRPPRRTGPANDLHIKLEEAYDQFKSMEKERKKFEGEMARQNPGKKVSSTNNAVLPRLPTNPSRVDRLIVDSLKEHSKVITLLVKMEGLNEKAFHSNIHSAMDGWLDSTRKVQARRKEEIINATNRHRSGAPRNHDERDVIALATAIAELSVMCRRARTAFWCALQISWKPGFIPLGVMSKRAEVVAREKEAMKEQQQLLASQALAANRSASNSSSVSNVTAASVGSSLSSCSVGSSLLSGSMSGLSLPDVPPGLPAAAAGPAAVVHSLSVTSPFSSLADGNNNMSAVGKAEVA